MIVNEEPKFCIRCGDRLKPEINESFDPFTGKKIRTANPDHLFCNNLYCYAAGAFRQTDGTWKIPK